MIRCDVRKQEIMLIARLKYRRKVSEEQLRSNKETILSTVGNLLLA